MIEVLIRIPEDRFTKVRKMLGKYGVDIVDMLDAYDDASYGKLESFRLKNIEGIVSIGGDALADTESVFE